MTIEPETLSYSKDGKKEKLPWTLARVVTTTNCKLQRERESYHVSYSHGHRPGELQQYLEEF